MDVAWRRRLNAFVKCSTAWEMSRLWRCTNWNRSPPFLSCLEIDCSAFGLVSAPLCFTRSPSSRKQNVYLMKLESEMFALYFPLIPSNILRNPPETIGSSSHLECDQNTLTRLCDKVKQIESKTKVEHEKSLWGFPGHDQGGLRIAPEILQRHDVFGAFAAVSWVLCWCHYRIYVDEGILASRLLKLPYMNNNCTVGRRRSCGSLAKSSLKVLLNSLKASHFLNSIFSLRPIAFVHTRVLHIRGHSSTTLRHCRVAFQTQLLLLQSTYVTFQQLSNSTRQSMLITLKQQASFLRTQRLNKYLMIRKNSKKTFLNLSELSLACNCLSKKFISRRNRVKRRKSSWAKTFCHSQVFSIFKIFSFTTSCCEWRRRWCRKTVETFSNSLESRRKCRTL